MAEPLKWLRDEPWPPTARERRGDRRADRAERRYFRALRRAEEKTWRWRLRQAEDELVRALIAHIKIPGYCPTHDGRVIAIRDGKPVDVTKEVIQARLPVDE